MESVSLNLFKKSVRGSDKCFLGIIFNHRSNMKVGDIVFLIIILITIHKLNCYILTLLFYVSLASHCRFIVCVFIVCVFLLGVRTGAVGLARARGMLYHGCIHSALVRDNINVIYIYCLLHEIGSFFCMPQCKLSKARITYFCRILP